MNKICISDITMKQEASGGYSLTFREKLELAKLLDRLGLCVIELEGIQNPKTDALRIKSIAALVKESAVAVPVALEPEGVDKVWAALKEAKHPRLQVAAPVSPMQMEYLFHKKGPAMLKAIGETVAYCKAFCPDVEFVADDATRSDPEFLYEAVKTAIAAGASTVTLCDTAGAMLPDEFTAFLDGVYENVPMLKNISLGVSCSDELSMADACAVAAVRRGAKEVKAAAYRVNTVSLANLAKLLQNKQDVCGGVSSVRTTQMKRTLTQIAWMCKTSRSETSPFDNGVQEVQNDKLALTAHDEKPAVDRAVEQLGYDLSEEDKQRVWQAFQSAVSRKETVGLRELDAIVASAAMQVPDTYRLESYVINTGNTVGSTAHLRIRYKDTVMEGLSGGDGSVDAAFLAIEQVAGRHYELDDFQIQAVTEGREAMGETVVKLRSNGKLYSGRGLSTDIAGSAILAYINALNKIVYEEEMA